MPVNKEPKIYILPNLMTAGNLFCGFAAILFILEGMLSPEKSPTIYYEAIGCILGSFLFDMLDGKLARISGSNSAFGREFDSLADIVSFGIAPSLLVYEIVLKDFSYRVGWMIAFIYLLCGALRLARFNCKPSKEDEKEEKNTKAEFEGFPIPAAAGVISTITLLLITLDESNRELGKVKLILPFLLIFLSFMMFTRIKYPSFKNFSIRSQKSIRKFFLIVIVLLLNIIYWKWLPPFFFIGYLFYGIIRPIIAKKLKK